MNFFFYILIGFGLIFLILTLIGYFIDREVKHEENILISAEAKDIFALIGNFEEFVKWSPWSVKDPNMEMKFEGEKFSVGHKYSWKGNKTVGTGYMEIDHIEANQRIDINLSFGQRGDSKTSFILEPVDNGTLVRWTFETDLGGNITFRFMGPLMKKFLGKDFREGLQNLKNQFNS
jgi:carbon monoxide dehydrogenase subunit G